MLKKIYFRLLGLIALRKIKKAKSFSLLCDELCETNKDNLKASFEKTRLFVLLSVCAYRCFKENDTVNGSKVYRTLVKLGWLKNMMPEQSAFLLEAEIWEAQSTRDILLHKEGKIENELESLKYQFIDCFFDASNIRDTEFNYDILKVEKTFFVPKLAFRCMQNYYYSKSDTEESARYERLLKKEMRANKNYS